MVTSFVPAARRRLTGVARGVALAIARHSLRGASSASAGIINEPSTARMVETGRNMAGPFPRKRPECIAESGSALSWLDQSTVGASARTAYRELQSWVLAHPP